MASSKPLMHHYSPVSQFSLNQFR